MKNKLICLFAVLAAAFVVAGCTQQESTTTPAPADTNAPAAPAE